MITFGGSYPGWMSAMMRLRYPAVVDAAYAASAPMRFYAQQVPHIPVCCRLQQPIGGGAAHDAIHHEVELGLASGEGIGVTSIRRAEASR